MDVTNERGVTSVADARAGLSVTLRRFRSDPAASPVVLGSHRRPEAVLMSFDAFRALSSRGPRHERSLLSELKSRGALIRRLAEVNKLTDVAVFGSVARGEDGPDSDIDLAVTASRDASFFDLAQFQIDVESLMGRDVDVVSRNGLDIEKRERFFVDSIAL